jgi:hypothetical protein
MRTLFLFATLAVVGCDEKPKAPKVTETPKQQAQPAPVEEKKDELPKVNPPIVQPPTPPKAEKKTFPRDGFSEMIRGKTGDQIKELLGLPSESVDVTAAPGRISVLTKKWIYYGIVKNPDTEKMYRVTEIWFNDKKAYHAEHR